MRCAIVADIHANLIAFEAVLTDIEGRGGVDEIWCLGDVVGYGPDPHACIQLLLSHKHVAVAGNHDWAAIGKLELADFNPDATSAILWTAQQLNPGDVSYLSGLPLKLEQGDFTLVHGSPREPIWEYLYYLQDAQANFPLLHTPYCLVGHSHIPLCFDEEDGVSLLPSHLSLGRSRLIINPGGVGQPRDGDCRASYIIYDSEERAMYHFRIPYDIASTQKRMIKLGISPFLAHRLSYGR